MYFSLSAAFISDCAFIIWVVIKLCYFFIMLIILLIWLIAISIQNSGGVSVRVYNDNEIKLNK